MRIHIFATDMPPLAGLPANGLSLRTHFIGEGLKAAGCEVMLSVPKFALAEFDRVFGQSHLLQQHRQLLKDLAPFAFDHLNQQALIEMTRPDAILCGHWPAYTMAGKPDYPVIVDLAGPYLHQCRAEGRKDLRNEIAGKISILQRADYWIVSSHEQSRYFQDFCRGFGFHQSPDRIVQVMMALPTPPIREDASSCSLTFLSSGLHVGWQDPSRALKRVSKELGKRQQGRLHLIGGPHPYYHSPVAHLSRLMNSLKKKPWVSEEGLLDFDTYVERVKTVDVAVDLMERNPERVLAVPVRTTIYLWAGVPVLYNNYSELSMKIQEYQAGWCLDPRDRRGLKKALDEIFDNPAELKMRSQNAQRLARDLFVSEQSLKPLFQVLGLRNVDTKDSIRASIGAMS